MNPMAAADRATPHLSVNLNKVALLRNSRSLDLPSITHAAQAVLLAGAQGITVHPRPDQRHIRTHDVIELASLLRHTWPHIEYNIEGNPGHNLLDFLPEATRPQQMTFVPDSVGQSTSDHGWDLPSQSAELAPLIARAKTAGVRVSLFMDPTPQAMASAAALGADRVELYTEGYARAFTAAMTQPGPDSLEALESTLQSYVDSAQAAQAAGLGINAGHDLNLDNLTLFAAQVPQLAEVSIGHAFIADALDLGYTGATRAYLAALQRAGSRAWNDQPLSEAVATAVRAARETQAGAL